MCILFWNLLFVCLFPVTARLPSKHGTNISQTHKHPGKLLLPEVLICWVFILKHHINTYLDTTCGQSLCLHMVPFG